jgi:hypothetical protein
MELLALHVGQQTLGQISTVRQRGDELTAAITRVEHALEEANESLVLRDPISTKT